MSVTPRGKSRTEGLLRTSRYTCALEVKIDFGIESNTHSHVAPMNPTITKVSNAQPDLANQPIMRVTKFPLSLTAASAPTTVT